MAALLQASIDSGLGKLLAGKHEYVVPSFVAERHTVGNGILSRHPPYIDSERLIYPRPGLVERFVAKSFHHAAQFGLGLRAWHSRDETDNPWHKFLCKVASPRIGAGRVS
jgi:hypothetical protein